MDDDAFFAAALELEQSHVSASASKPNDQARGDVAVTPREAFQVLMQAARAPEPTNTAARPVVYSAVQVGLSRGFFPLLFPLPPL